MARWLVTGGCGFVGSNLIRMILRDRPGVRVRNLDNLSLTGDRSNLAEFEGDDRYEFVLGDVSDEGVAWEAVRGCDAVLHLAAESHVDRSIDDPRGFVVSNVVGTQTLLDAWRGVAGGDGAAFVQVSTDEVYGSLEVGGGERFTEDSPLRPSSAYAASKAGADLLARAACVTHGMRVVTTRSTNNYGAWQWPEKVVPRFVSCLMAGERVPLYGDGSHVRDWMDVEDHCEGILLAMEKGRAGGVYNLGASNERSNLELARVLLGVFGLGEEMIERVADRPGHDRRYAVDATRAREELGWEARRTAWPLGIEAAARWYMGHGAWCEAARERLRRRRGGGAREAAR